MRPSLERAAGRGVRHLEGVEADAAHERDLVATARCRRRAARPRSRASRAAAARWRRRGRRRTWGTPARSGRSAPGRRRCRRCARRRRGEGRAACCGRPVRRARRASASCDTITGASGSGSPSTARTHASRRKAPSRQIAPAGSRASLTRAGDGCGVELPSRARLALTHVPGLAPRASATRACRFTTCREVHPCGDGRHGVHP